MPPKFTDQFGWTSYRKEGWVDKHNRKLYRAKFTSAPGTPSFRWTEVTIRFWAKHPIKTLRRLAGEAKSADDLVRHNGGTFD